MKKFWDISFPKPLVLEHVDEEIWRLARDFECLYVEDREPKKMIIRKGFQNDLSSIPRWARSIIPVVGNQNNASVVHDYLYENRGDIMLADGTKVVYTREDSDRLFWAGLRARGLSVLKARFMYLAVRIGGKRAWET